MKKILFSIFLLSSLFLQAQDKPAYQIYDKDGKPVTWKSTMKAAAGADVFFFGELHNNPISHWLQIEATKDLHKRRKGKLVLGAEMFEADNQLVMDEYLQGKIKRRSFLDEMRLWPNYETDYAPLVEFAKEQNLRFIATNVPRRYAKVVYNDGLEGLEALSDDAKRFLPPLPIVVDLELSSYKEMLAMASGHGGENLPKAQAIKDATMAHFLVQNRASDQLFIHYNGAYHSDGWEGIVWYVKQAQPEWKIVTLTTVTQANIDKLDAENQNKADYILVVPENMTPTH